MLDVYSPYRELTPDEHIEALHARETPPARVALAMGGQFKKYRHYSLEELLRLAPGLAGKPDTYVSTQSFHGRRKTVNLARLSSLHVELDRHELPAAEVPLDLYPSAGAADRRGYGRSHDRPDPRRDLEEVLIALENYRLPGRGGHRGPRHPLPDPSLAIFSGGRGLHLYWLHSPVPRWALPRWRAMQLLVWNALSSYGADRAATDPARMMRLCGTTHSKTGEKTRSVFYSQQVYGFEELADAILPYSREQIALWRARTQEKKQRAAEQKEARADPRKEAPAFDWTWGTLHESELSDVEDLARERGGKFPEGYRNEAVFTAGCALAWLVPPAKLHGEIREFARRYTDLPAGELQNVCAEVVRRAHSAARGETITWKGRPKDPRYTLSHERIIHSLEITGAEMRGLKTLIDNAEKRRRHREREEKRRRAAGAMKREDYEGRAADRRAEARRMASEGLSDSKIAKTLGVAPRTVRHYLI